MKNIDTDLILASLNRGEGYVIKDVTDKMLSYVRCWANRKGFFVSRVNSDAHVMKEPRNKLRTELFKKLKTGEKFVIECPAGKTGYLRMLVSQFNRDAEIKRRTRALDNGFYLIYPDPAHDIEELKTLQVKSPLKGIIPKADHVVSHIRRADGKVTKTHYNPKNKH